MSNHLWQFTWFALAAALLAWMLRRNRAGVRFWLWFSASIKFLVPFALFMSIGALLPQSHRAPISPTALSFTAVEMALPFHDATPAAPATHNWLPLIWICGSLAVVTVRLRGWVSLRHAVRFTPELLEPGVVGLWHPKLILPAGIEERLNAPQLEAIMAHEMCHVRRRDNLLASIHMTVEAIFWFHPLVWWIGARLIEERERACDEEVLRSGNSADVYAEAILNVCKFYAESPLPSVAGVTGADLKRRIAAILSYRAALQLNFARKAMLAAAGFAALSAPVVIGILHAQSAPKFEVVSIKPCSAGDFAAMVASLSASGGGRGGSGPSAGNPGRLSLPCRKLDRLISDAYLRYAGGRENAVVSGGEATLRGLPAWVETERYTIDAKPESPQPMETMLGPMMQSILEDRFHLQLHRQTKDVPAYAMGVAKDGLKLPAAKGCPPTDGAAVSSDADPRPCGFVGDFENGFVAHGWTMTNLCSFLGHRLERDVIDRTGLSAAFDLLLDLPPTPPPGAGEPLSAATAISALRKVGLTLESARATAEFLVIDRIERPSPN